MSSIQQPSSTLKVCASERDVSVLTITPRAQPKLNNGVVNPQPSILMKKLPLLILLMLVSCTEVMYLTVEQMLPPEVATEHIVRSVGVVNNFSPNNVVVINEDAYVFPCNADSVREHIALCLAEAGIMDRVVILDSLLYPAGGTSSHKLSQIEVNELCKQLEVDMLYSLEYACVTIGPAPDAIGRPMNAYLCTRIYTPDNDSISGTAILDKKMLEYWAYDTAAVNIMMPMIPTMLAQNAINPCLPSWKERERVFYTDALSYELREAKVYVSEGNWDAAAQLWHTLEQSKIRGLRFISAYNMALYYEMTDSIDKAIASLDLARQHAVKITRQGTPVLCVDTALVHEYHEVLINRRKEIAQLERYIERVQ